MAAMGSRTAGARGAVGRRAASSTASVIRLRGVIIKSMGDAWSMSALQAHYGLKSDITPSPKSAMNGLTLTWLLWERMLEEETQHFPRCVRSSRISVGARRAASRPCVSSSVDVPVLKDCTPTRVGTDRAGIGMPSRYPPAMHVLLRARRSHRLFKNLIAVVWMHRNVAIAVKNNGRDRWPVT